MGWKELNHQASKEAREGDPKKAEELWREALRELVQKGNSGREDSLLVYYNLFRHYLLLDDLKRAEKVGQQQLDVSLRVHGKLHGVTAKVHSGLGELYERQFKYEDALEHYRLALAAWEHSMGPEHIKTGELLHRMSLFACVTGLSKKLYLWHHC